MSGGAPHHKREFLAEPCPVRSLLLLFGRALVAESWSVETIASRLSREIERLDAIIARQVEEVIHHPAFQRLEASWRGLRYLIDEMDADLPLQVRVLDVRWRELERDLEDDVAQSAIYRKVYSEEFDMPGGSPYGALLGDFHVSHRVAEDDGADDIAVLRGMAKVSAAAFAPFITAASPAFFGLRSFSQLGGGTNLRATFAATEYGSWKSFRKLEDARFIGLTLPRVLMRPPHDDDGTRDESFRFRETVGPRGEGSLWGNSIYAFGRVLLRVFRECGWLADIRGCRREGSSIVGGGLVRDLPSYCFGADRAARKFSTEVVVVEELERELSELGFVPLCHCKDTSFAVFLSSRSAQQPDERDDLVETMSARISSLLQYVLCASRFAHYLQAIALRNLGSPKSAGGLQAILESWISEYVAPDPSPEHPLREAAIQVRRGRGTAGRLYCDVSLKPHYQLDSVVAELRLKTQFRTPFGSRPRPASADGEDRSTSADD